jgi:two-component system chemotaxis response regulator CheY
VARILIVDDNELMRALLRMHLGQAGYEVEEAEDAIRAGHAVLRSPPSLIICDVNMPHMTGFEFISALKGDKSVPDIPVIFLSSEDDVRDQSQAAGAALYLRKPIVKEQLLAVVRRYCPLK